MAFKTRNEAVSALKREKKVARQAESRELHDRKQSSRIERDKLLHAENERHIAASRAIWDRWRAGSIEPATRTLRVPAMVSRRSRVKRTRR